MQTGMDYKTGGRSNCKKEWWNQISLYPYIQTHAQVGIQTEKVPRKTHVNTASKEKRKKVLKKSQKDTGYSPTERRVYSSIYR